jgi:LIVCS family branched-chain amino acid:cation transporter
LAIVLIILSLLFPVLNKAEEVYKWTTALTIFAAFFDLCNALPDTIKKSSVINSLIKFARVYLPGFDFGFGWLIPALVGFIIGIVLWKVRGRSLEQ